MFQNLSQALISETNSVKTHKFGNGILVYTKIINSKQKFFFLKNTISMNSLKIKAFTI